MKFKEIYIKYKPLIWPIFSGIASLVVLGAVIIPQVMAYLAVRNKMSDFQNKINSLEVKADELGQINDQKTKTDLQTAFAILPTEIDIAGSMAILQNLVSQSGLTLKNTAFSPPTEANKNNFRFTLTVQGQLNGIRNFILTLQDSPRLFQVDYLNIVYQKNLGIVEAEIPVMVFYMPQSGGLGAIDQPAAKLNESEIKQLNKLSTLLSSLNQAASTSSATPSAIVASPLGKSDPFE